MVDCTAKLCDNCLKTGHESDDCPLLTMPKPVVTIYGVRNNRLMFFESPCSNLSRLRLENARTGIVRVSGGSLSDDQVVQQLRRLVPGDFRWTPILLEENVFKVDFEEGRFDKAHGVWYFQSA